MPDNEASDKSAEAQAPPSQSGGVNIDGRTTVGGSLVGRDSVSNVTTSTTSTSTTTVNEGGPVTRYAVLGVIGIAALAIVVTALVAIRGLFPAPAATATPSATATATIMAASSFTAGPPTYTATPTPTSPPLTQTPSPTASLSEPATPTASAWPTATATVAAPPTATSTATTTATVTATSTATPTAAIPVTPSSTPLPTVVLPVYDDFAGRCLLAARWMLDWQPDMATPTPGAPICLDTDPQYMAQDDGLVVFLGQDDTANLSKGETHSLTSAGSGFFRRIEVSVTLNQADVLTVTHTAYLSVAVPAIRANLADMEIRVQGGHLAGKPVYQVTSYLILRDGSGLQQGLTFPYALGQTLTIDFVVKGNKLTAYVNGEPILGPYSILTEPPSVTLGYHVDQQTLLDGTFNEVSILQLVASEIQLPTPANTLTPP